MLSLGGMSLYFISEVTLPPSTGIERHGFVGLAAEAKERNQFHGNLLKSTVGGSVGTADLLAQTLFLRT